ncbi:MAG: hypothetical protein EOO44_19415 [Flavobacterium sp.]|nr:MAG: hypothetical protein EOO44_19415 [Flavobacterium sp.]
MQKVSPWSATAQKDIESSEVLLEKEVCNYTYQICNTGDSIWVVAVWPDTGKMAFRCAFGMNSIFEVSNLFEDEDVILIQLKTRLGKYEIRISFPDPLQPLLHYKTTFKADSPLMIPFWPRDIVPLTKNGNIINTSGKVHVHQTGARSGLLLASMSKPKTGTVFYFQNLSSLSGYCKATKTSLEESVGGEWPEIGFKLPETDEYPLPIGKSYIISDAYVLLGENVAENEIQLSRLYLDQLAVLYNVIPHPEPKYNDWPEIAQNVLSDLHLNKGCWTQTNGVAYLNAYLCDYATPAESMVQLAVLTPLVEYQRWSGENHPLFEELNSGIPAFYDPKIKCINRWLPELHKDLDESEEQKTEKVMDSWYLHHPLMNLTRLAIDGSKVAEKLVLDSVDFVINIAHHFKYEWPVFYNLETLEVVKKETEPGNGGEKDVPGSYAHLMLLIFRLTKNKRYLHEAERAAKTMTGLGFEVFYQANNTAFAACALLELYKITNKQQYLESSYLCLAGVLKNVQLWNCGYGFGKNYNSFFAVFPLNDAPYTAAYEEMEVYAALSHYLIEAKDVAILPSLRILIPEFVKYAVGRISSYYPSLLPKEMLSDEVKTGEIQKNLWVPVEDLYSGWEQSGQVGQEVYGAGIAFGVVPRQYLKVNEDFMIFIDYPVTQFSKRGNSVSILLDGNQDMSCNLKLIWLSKNKIKPTITQEKKILNPSYKKIESMGFIANGKGLIKIKW